MLTNDKCNDCEELARLHFQAQELIRKLNEVPVDDMDIRKSIVNKLLQYIYRRQCTYQSELYLFRFGDNHDRQPRSNCSRRKNLHGNTSS